MFRDDRQLIAFVVVNAVLIAVAAIAQWWWLLGVVLLTVASGLVYRFAYWRRHRRSGVIP